MNWSRLGILLTVLGSTSLGADDPPFKTGQNEFVFDRPAPRSTAAELKRRFRATNDAPAFDLAKESFRVDVPKSYEAAKEAAKAWGLFVWIDPSPQPNVPADWGPILAEKRLLLVAANNSGNDRALFDRCRLAVDAVHNMTHRFRVDPTRVYVAGMSGGGRVASMLGVAYADVFTGAVPMVGANFYKPVPTGDTNKAWIPVYQPDGRILVSAKTKNHYVLLTGETDFNRENTLRVYREGFKAEDFRHVLYLEVPGMGHSRAPADWLAKGIAFLDEAP